MARYVLSCSALFLVVCLYLATNQVDAQDGEQEFPYDDVMETTEFNFPCDKDMEVGDTRSYDGCTYCTCTEEKLTCNMCPWDYNRMKTPKGCYMDYSAGDFPDCCKEEPVCP